MPPTPPNDDLDSGGEISIAGMFRLIVSGWRTTAGAVIVCVLLALLKLSFASPVYTGTMVVAPVPQENSQTPTASALGGVLGALSGGVQTDDLFKRYQALFASVTLAERLQQRHHTLQTIYGGNWDAKSGRWVDRPTWRRLVSGPLNMLAGVPTWIAPNTVDLATYLADAVLVRSTLRNDFVRITYTSANPEYASLLLRQMHQAADDLLREQAARRAQQKVVYLEGKLATTNVTDYRQALLGLLGEQQKILLLTQPGTSYAAEMVDEPVTDPRPSAPKPTLTILIAILAGLAIGMAISLTWGPVTRAQIVRLGQVLRAPRRWLP